MVDVTHTHLGCYCSILGQVFLVNPTLKASRPRHQRLWMICILSFTHRIKSRVWTSSPRPTVTSLAYQSKKRRGVDVFAILMDLNVEYHNKPLCRVSLSAKQRLRFNSRPRSLRVGSRPTFVVAALSPTSAAKSTQQKMTPRYSRSRAKMPVCKLLSAPVCSMLVCKQDCRRRIIRQRWKYWHTALRFAVFVPYRLFNVKAFRLLDK